jgi:UDP-GlcNAc3NAcA epimerase
MKKVVTILGARPQFIKAATLSRVFNERGINEVIIHTGQHYDWNMSDIFFDQMAIPKPSYSLNISSKHHGEMTGKMLEGIEKVLLEERPEAVLVYGDTNSTLAGALAAAKLHVPIAHVEAGLRSFNRLMPEEVNRVLTDHMATWLFAPTNPAVNNLLREGIKSESIHQVGDVMYDAVVFYQKIAEQQSDVLTRLDLVARSFILATIHRAENTNSPEKLKSIFSQLEALSRDKLIVLPLHPRTRSLLDRDYSTDRFMIIDPVGYFDMILLQKNCKLIVTDSGGVQKEAFFNDKFCITVREETEWVELVDNGFNFLANPISTVQTLVRELWDRQFDSQGKMLYGNGKSAELIIDILEKKI